MGRLSFRLGWLLLLLLCTCAAGPHRRGADRPPASGAVRAAAPSDAKLDAKIDRHALAAPTFFSVELLARYLMSGPAKSERDLARAVYTWMTHRIDYDIQAVERGTTMELQQVSEQELLTQRRGVCTHFSGLFLRLGQAVGLQVEEIEGSQKGSRQAGPEGLAADFHAWNAVLLDGLWYFIDASNGAGQRDQESGRVRKRPSYDWFLVPPQRLARTHTPTDPRYAHLSATPAPARTMEYAE